MDALMGLLILVAVIWIVRAALDGGGEGGTGRGEGGTGRGDRRPGAPGVQPGDNRSAPPPTPLDERERQRRERADEAFIDGVLFAHHFDPFDRFGTGSAADDEQEAYWGDDDLDAGLDDGLDDDGWDDAFHDDAGDW